MFKDPISSRWIVRNAVITASVVGTILNVINHGNAILEGTAHWGQLMLNYLIPFSVATYSGFKTYARTSGIPFRDSGNRKSKNAF